MKNYVLKCFSSFVNDQFLPIPELMPFRLTRQLRAVNQPLGERGVMEGVMVATVTAMRRHAHILLSTMDIFIKEPSLDWKVSLCYRQTLMIP